MRNVRFADDEIYHVYNRGVEKRDVFQGDGDRVRFIHHLYELNDAGSPPNLSYHLSRSDWSEHALARPRTKLVNILSFALMPNHYHLLLQQNTEGGISKFMQKLGTGYTMFFNEKNERSGVLFQGKFKAVHVSSDDQLRWVLHYIHLNPISLLDPTIPKKERCRALREYRWSSLPDYIGIRNFPSVTDRHLLTEIFGGAAAYEKDLITATMDETNIEIDHALLHDHPRDKD